MYRRWRFSTGRVVAAAAAAPARRWAGTSRGAGGDLAARVAAVRAQLDEAAAGRGYRCVPVS